MICTYTRYTGTETLHELISMNFLRWFIPYNKYVYVINLNDNFLYNKSVMIYLEDLKSLYDDDDKLQLINQSW